jgi:hypothetical protein
MIARQLKRAWDLAWELIIPPLGLKAVDDLTAALQEALLAIAHPYFLVSHLRLIRDYIPAILDQKSWESFTNVEISSARCGVRG